LRLRKKKDRKSMLTIFLRKLITPSITSTLVKKVTEIYLKLLLVKKLWGQR